jgi:hypothetical protein
MRKSLKTLLKKEAKNAAKREKLHGIDPRSYLGAEILKQSREIIKLRRSVHELTVIMRKQRNT